MTDLATKARVRVLFFIPNLGAGGAERVLINLLRHIDRDRFDPHLVLMRLEGPYADRIPDDIPVEVLGARSLWTTTPRLMRAMRRLQPDVVVAATGGAGVPTVLAHRLLRSTARLIVWERNVLVGSESGPKRDVLLAMKKQLWPRADLITAVGRYVEADIQRHAGVGPEKTKTLYSPILDADFRRQAAEEVDHPWFHDDEVPVVLCVARYTAAKDHETLLKAFAKVRSQRAIRLVLLGKGPLREQVEEQARALGIHDDIWFAGFVSNPFKYMSHSAMLVLCSLQEGVPGVVVQAMGCGLPVVGTDSPGGTGELVLDEQTGLLIEMRDVEALAHSIERYLDDPAFARRMAEHAREHVHALGFEAEVALAGFERSIVTND
jgi:glycosyltransferase involved in cell wall biosynthesis